MSEPWCLGRCSWEAPREAHPGRAACHPVLWAGLAWGNREPGQGHRRGQATEDPRRHLVGTSRVNADTDLTLVWAKNDSGPRGMERGEPPKELLWGHRERLEGPIKRISSGPENKRGGCCPAHSQLQVRASAPHMVP